jgi:hypothetical protein
MEHQMGTRDQISKTLPEQILSEFHREVLSQDAIKLFEAVWFRMAYSGVTQIRMADDQVSIRARVPLHRIAAAQSELSAAGLLEIDPFDQEVRYGFIDDEDEANINTH